MKKSFASFDDSSISRHVGALSMSYFLSATVCAVQMYYMLPRLSVLCGARLTCLEFLNPQPESRAESTKSRSDGLILDGRRERILIGNYKTLGPRL